jgi:hypothetical protein
MEVNGGLLGGIRDKGIISFYENLYEKIDDWFPKVDGMQFSLISEEEREWLERQFEEEEVHLAITNMNGDKAPRHDGLK